MDTVVQDDLRTEVLARIASTEVMAERIDQLDATIDDPADELLRPLVRAAIARARSTVADGATAGESALSAAMQIRDPEARRIVLRTIVPVLARAGAVASVRMGISAIETRKGRHRHQILSYSQREDSCP